MHVKMNNDVKGGLVTNQLKRYAKRIADITDDAASAEIVVWFHPNKSDGTGRFYVEFKAFCHAAKVNIRPRFETDDLRWLGEEIEVFLMHGIYSKGE